MKFAGPLKFRHPDADRRSVLRGSERPTGPEHKRQAPAPGLGAVEDTGTVLCADTAGTRARAAGGFCPLKAGALPHYAPGAQWGPADLWPTPRGDYYYYYYYYSHYYYCYYYYYGYVDADDYYDYYHY